MEGPVSPRHEKNKGNFKFPELVEAPSRDIDNEVVYVNPRFAESMPFKIGDRDPAVSFVTSPKDPKADGHVEGRLGHYRSALNPSGRTFELKDFPYSDSKGVGDFVHASWGSLGWDPRGPIGLSKLFSNYMLGLCNLPDARADAEMTEKLIEAGVRPGCVISSISKLKEIPMLKDDGTIDVIPATETKKPLWISNKMREGKFEKKMMPAVMRRHYSWPIRVIDFENPRLSILERTKMIDATIEHISAKHGIEKTYDAYLKWFAQDLAESIALMHVAGYHHWYLHTQNILADGGIMDNDSAGRISMFPWKKYMQKKRDIDHMTSYQLRTGGKFNIEKLYGHLQKVPAIASELHGKISVRELQDVFDHVYATTLQNPEIVKARRHVI